MPARRRLRLRKPVVLKLVVSLILLTAGASLWQGMRDYHLSKRRLEQLKNENGVQLVRQLTIFIPPFWLKDSGAENASAAANNATSTLGREEVEAKLRELKASDSAEAILDIVIFSAEKETTFYASLSGKSSFVWSEGQTLQVPFAEKAGVTIVEGKQGGTPVRSFTAAITRPESTKPLGKVVVYLSAADLQKAKDSHRNEVVRNVIICIVLAAVFSAVLGTILSRPLRTLAHDMRAVSTGDLERRSSVSSADEVGDLARTFNRMVSSLEEVQERRATQKAIEKELGIARRIQKGLLPHQIPTFSAWDVAARWIPAKEVGGDYYDFIPLQGGAFGAVVADVSGKGVPAALVMSMTRCLLRLATRAGLGPSGTIGLVEDVLSPDLQEGMFISLVYLQFSDGERSIRLVRAGHNPPLIIRNRENTIEQCTVPGVAIGLRTGFGHQAQRETELDFAPGDALVLYSDGIVEAMNAQKEEFGEKRFSALLKQGKELPAAELTEAVIRHIAKWRGAASQSDDITLVVFKRKS